MAAGSEPQVELLDMCYTACRPMLSVCVELRLRLDQHSGCAQQSEIRPSRPIGKLADFMQDTEALVCPPVIILPNMSISPGEMLYGCTCNMSVSTRHIRHMFDPAFPSAAYEDVDFCLRNRLAGTALSYDPRAVVKHSFKPGLTGIYAQFQRYGAQEHLLLAKHNDYLHWLELSDEVPAHVACSPSV